MTCVQHVRVCVCVCVCVYNFGLVTSANPFMFSPQMLIPTSSKFHYQSGLGLGLTKK